MAHAPKPLRYLPGRAVGAGGQLASVAVHAIQALAFLRARSPPANHPDRAPRRPRGPARGRAGPPVAGGRATMSLARPPRVGARLRTRGRPPSNERGSAIRW